MRLRRTLPCFVLAGALAWVWSIPGRADPRDAPSRRASVDDWVPWPKAQSTPSAEKALEEATIVQTKERFVAGTEPHSPATHASSFGRPENVRLFASAQGPVGLNRVSIADLGRASVLRLAVNGELSSVKNFPVTGTSNTRTFGALAASFVPLDFLEAYLAYGASTNANALSAPTLIQAMGDMSFGLKLARKSGTGLFAGVDLRGLSFSPIGRLETRGFAFGFAPRAVVTIDLQELWSAPLRLHLNGGVALDGSGKLAAGRSFTAVEEYALNINRYNRALGSAAIEAPMPWLTAFVEYALAHPLGVPDRRLIGTDGGQVLVSQAMNQVLGAGLRLTAVKDVTFTAGVELGLARLVGLGVPATPPWSAMVGVGFNVDPFEQAPVRVVETLRERQATVVEAPKTAKVSGTVLDSRTKKPVPGVIVAMVGTRNPPVASEDSGRFLTQDLPSGRVKLAARKDGYRETTQDVVLEAGKTAMVELMLESGVAATTPVTTAVQPATAPVTGSGKTLFNLSVMSRKKPIAATVSIKGPKSQQLELPASGGLFPVEVPSGTYQVNVSAEGHLASTRDVAVSEGARMDLAFDLEPEPKRRLVIVKEDKIQILQQVNFATNRATILPDSFGLLFQVIDAIAKHDIKRVRIEGHTDNRGSKMKNLSLSSSRARAIKDFLVKAGIDPKRLETIGYGDARPVAPNMTPRGRELNRRVEFIITER